MQGQQSFVATLYIILGVLILVVKGGRLLYDLALLGFALWLINRGLVMRGMPDLLRLFMRSSGRRW